MANRFLADREILRQLIPLKAVNGTLALGVTVGRKCRREPHEVMQVVSILWARLGNSISSEDQNRPPSEDDSMNS